MCVCDLNDLLIFSADIQGKFEAKIFMNTFFKIIFEFYEKKNKFVTFLYIILHGYIYNIIIIIII